MTFRTLGTIADELRTGRREVCDVTLTHRSVLSERVDLRFRVLTTTK